MLPHAIANHFVVREQLQGLLVAAKQVLGPAERIQLFGPPEECVLKSFLHKRENSNLADDKSDERIYNTG